MGPSGDYEFENDEFGYYSIEYAVMDDAGNRADFVTAGGVIDEDEPSASVLIAGNAGRGRTYDVLGLRIRQPGSGSGRGILCGRWHRMRIS